MEPVIISISKYKMALLSEIYKNPKIVEAIASQQDGVIPDEPDSLMYKNLFPYLRIPGTEKDTDTYVLLKVDKDRVNRNNRVYSRYQTTMWALAHQDRMQMDARFNATRIDYIAEELTRMFHGQQRFGFSKFELISDMEVILDTKYLYRELVFRCNDLRQPIAQW